MFKGEFSNEPIGRVKGGWDLAGNESEM